MESWDETEFDQPGKPDKRGTETEEGTGDEYGTSVGLLPVSKHQTALDVPWNVIVHNDPITLMDYVTMVFRRVFGFSREKAEHHMHEVHELGKSIVWSGNREHAELYAQELHGYQLLATIERASE